MVVADGQGARSARDARRRGRPPPAVFQALLGGAHDRDAVRPELRRRDRDRARAARSARACGGPARRGGRGPARARRGRGRRPRLCVPVRGRAHAAVWVYGAGLRPHGDRRIPCRRDGHHGPARRLCRRALRRAHPHAPLVAKEVIRMKKLLMLGAALAASIVVAACGGGSSDDSAAPASGGGKTVAVRSMDGIGKVLVDSSGKTLYASDVEADGKVHWTSSSFWKPLTVDSGTPTGAAGVGKLGVIKRPDGTRQVTANGRLLYTFTEDAPGKAEGNGFSDDSNGEHFTWNAVLAGGKVASGSGSQSGGSSGQDGY